MDLFQTGDFTLNSGAKSKWKLECDALTDGEIASLAVLIHEMVGPFGSVEGVPRGGLKLAAALQALVTPGGKHLIVDDVLTTGGSMERLRAGREDVLGAVVFARGRLPIWVRAVFQMPGCFWIQ